MIYDGIFDTQQNLTAILLTNYVQYVHTFDALRKELDNYI